ncbi:MAG TPA: metallophosphoesterase [Terriglobales bacterium]|nr:metallophosphoesterase [Terriglobales bacterium]
MAEAERPQLRRYEVPLRRLPGEFHGFTIAQLSDFHYDPVFSVTPIKAAVEMVNGLNADLVVLTGDFITTPLVDVAGIGAREAKQVAPCAELLSNIRCRNPLLAVLGNHDYAFDPEFVTRVLQSRGIKVLRNASHAVERNGARLWVAGVDDVLYKAARLDQTLKEIPATEATVLLCHEPDYADYSAKSPIDLQLSGHSHGGQIRLPLIGVPYLPQLARKYPWGMRQIGNTTLYTNCGIGTIRLAMRWNCPPEVTLFTLRAGDGSPRLL